MRRAGIGPEARNAVKAAYKTLYHRGLSVSSALEEILRGEMTPEVRHLVQFVQASKRGICKHYRRGAAGDEGD